MRFARTDNWRPRVFGGGLYEKVGRQTWPNLPVYDENGFYHNGNADVPTIGLEMGGNRDTQTDRLTQQGVFVFEPIKNWVTNIEFNYSTTAVGMREVSLPYYNHDVAGNIINTKGTSSLLQEQTKDSFYTLNIYSDYSHSLNDIHNFKVMAGFQAEEMNHSWFSSRAYGLLLEELPELDLTNSLDGAGNQRIPEVRGNRNSWATAGFFGRLNYDYKGKYLAEVNMRYDGTSRFRRGSRWALYPSISLGWNISHEEFWKPLEHVVNTFKLRGSYGELGNQNTTSRYPTYRVMELGAANGAWIQEGVRPNTSRIGSLISTTLTWETVRSWNTAIDWGMFRNRLTGSFDVYTRYTDNMVGPAPELPNILGISAPRTNNCDLRTQGWELELAWNDRLKNGLGYGLKLMISDAKTIIDSYPSNITKSLSTYNAGREIGEIWGYETIGIAKTQGEMDAHLEKVGGHSFGSEWGAGDIMYADLDGVPGISPGANTVDDHGDLKVIGNSTPRYHFGVDLNASYKGFDLRVFFQGILKRDIWNSTNMFFGTIGDQWWSAGLKEHGDYFRAEPAGLYNEIPANLDSYYPRPLFNTKNQRTQTRYLQDASYIRLKNLQVGYSLPSSLIKKISIDKCRIFVSGENLWTGTSLSKLFDPETVDGGNTDSSANAQIRNSGNAYPLSTTWAFGINITF
jgi:TonB-linked SusC/RagA family outer membrane protein